MKRKIVNAREWQNMDGRETITKMINSYITCKFIGQHAPSNECMYEAIDVINIASRNKNQEIAKIEISEYLNQRFMPSSLVSRIHKCLGPAEDILRIINTKPGADNGQSQNS